MFLGFMGSGDLQNWMHFGTMNRVRIDSLIINNLRTRFMERAGVRCFVSPSNSCPYRRRIVARFNSRSASRFLISSRLSNSCLPLPTASDTFTFPFFQ